MPEPGNTGGHYLRWGATKYIYTVCLPCWQKRVIIIIITIIIAGSLCNRAHPGTREHGWPLLMVGREKGAVAFLADRNVLLLLLQATCATGHIPEPANTGGHYWRWDAKKV